MNKLKKMYLLDQVTMSVMLHQPWIKMLTLDLMTELGITQFVPPKRIDDIASYMDFMILTESLY